MEYPTSEYTIATFLDFLGSPGVLDAMKRDGYKLNWAEVIKMVTDKPVIEEKRIPAGFAS